MTLSGRYKKAEWLDFLKWRAVAKPLCDALAIA